MSNSLFENPKIALGFAGAVVAIALVASVALDRFSSGKPGAEQIAEAEQTQPASPNPQQVQNAPATSAASGWAGDAGTTSDWGETSDSSQNGFERVPETANDQLAQDSGPVRRTPAARSPQPGAPSITTSVAPGVPDVVGPSSSGSTQIEVVSN